MNTVNSIGLTSMTLKLGIEVNCLPIITQLLEGYRARLQRIYNGNGGYMLEQLADFIDNDGKTIKPTKDALDIFIKNNMTFDLFKVVMRQAMEGIKDDGIPRSINAYLADIYHPMFITYVLNLKREFIGQVDPNKLIFELLEDGPGEYTESVKWRLKALKQYGFKIAFDDLNDSTFIRLEKLVKLGAFPNWIKICGKYFRKLYENRDTKDGGEEIKIFCSKVSKLCEGSESLLEFLIAEWVQSEDEAIFAYKVFGCNGFQGMYLPDDFLNSSINKSLH